MDSLIHSSYAHEESRNSTDKKQFQNAAQDTQGMIPAYYRCLGVHPSISREDLSSQYKKLSLELHPDRVFHRGYPPSKQDAQRYQHITEAYKVLSDPASRNAYDIRHGVNFHARISALQDSISLHNSLATQVQPGRDTRRRSRSRSPLLTLYPVTSMKPERAAGMVTGGVAESGTRADVQPRERHTEDCYTTSECTKEDTESEAEYDPEEFTRSEATPGSLSRAALLPPSCPSVGPAQPSLQSFTLSPVTPSASESDHDGLVTNRSYYKGVTIRRRTGAESWGLWISGDILVSCLSHPGVPFPAQIVQINGRSLPPYASENEVTRRLARSASRSPAFRLQTVQTRLSVHLSADAHRPNEKKEVSNSMVIEDAFSVPSLAHPQEGVCSTTANHSESLSGSSDLETSDGAAIEGRVLCERTDVSDEPGEELHLSLLYTLQTIRLAGDFMLLRETAFLDMLIPPDQLAAALPSLGLEAAVLSVNGEAVNNATELRYLLLRIANESTSLSGVLSTAILECVTLKRPV